MGPGPSFAPWALIPLIRSPSGRDAHHLFAKLVVDIWDQAVHALSCNFVHCSIMPAAAATAAAAAAAAASVMAVEETPELGHADNDDDTPPNAAASMADTPPYGAACVMAVDETPEVSHADVDDDTRPNAAASVMAVDETEAGHAQVDDDTRPNASASVAVGDPEVGHADNDATRPNAATSAMAVSTSDVRHNADDDSRPNAAVSMDAETPEVEQADDKDDDGVSIIDDGRPDWGECATYAAGCSEESQTLEEMMERMQEVDVFDIDDDHNHYDDDDDDVMTETSQSESEIDDYSKAVFLIPWTHLLAEDFPVSEGETMLVLMPWVQRNRYARASPY